MTEPTWKRALMGYTEVQIERLEFAAEIQAERVEKAAHDLTWTGVVDGIDISNLHFAVLRRREELEAEAAGKKPEATVPEPTPEPAEQAPEAEEVEEVAAEDEPVDEDPKPKRPTRARKSA